VNEYDSLASDFLVEQEKVYRDISELLEKIKDSGWRMEERGAKVARKRCLSRREEEKRRSRSRDHLVQLSSIKSDTARTMEVEVKKFGRRIS
jgi:hypothetical protein